MISGISYFFFAKKNANWQGKLSYNMIATTRRLIVSLLLIILGLLLFWDLIDM